MPSLMQISKDGLVDPSRRYRPIPHHVSTCLWEEEREDDEQTASEDGEEPKRRSPAQVLREQTSDGRAEGGSEQQTSRGVTHVFASLRRSGNVGDDRCGQRDRCAASECLHHPENQQRGVVCLQRQPDVGENEDDEADDEGQAPAAVIRHASDQGGCDRLCYLHNIPRQCLKQRCSRESGTPTHHICRQRQIDHRRRDVQLCSQYIQCRVERRRTKG